MGGKISWKQISNSPTRATDIFPHWCQFLVVLCNPIHLFLVLEHASQLTVLTIATSSYFRGYKRFGIIFSWNNLSVLRSNYFAASPAACCPTLFWESRNLSLLIQILPLESRFSPVLFWSNYSAAYFFSFRCLLPPPSQLEIEKFFLFCFKFCRSKTDSLRHESNAS